MNILPPKKKEKKKENSVHGFGYCIRDKRHVPAAEPLVFANSEGLYDNKLQRSGPKAAKKKCSPKA